ncbi:MAG: hypothetical protein EXS52_01390 [Candidatus Staskawiczbacteria bacterium]|nr:hypothetical protein [Candidatus Staskawiczbacteria bacterium]
MMYRDSQKGASLIVIFLIMTIMLAIVLSISVILSSQIKMISNMGNAVSSFYSAQTGLEEALYFEGKLAGTCKVCTICESADCDSCRYKDTAIGCEVDYSANFDERRYKVNMKLNAGIINITSKGDYKDTSRSINIQR